MINTTKIANLLRPGLKAVFGRAEGYKDQWQEVYKTYTSDRNQEFDQEMMFLGLANIKDEGAPISFGDMGASYQTTYVHKRVGLAFTITYEAIEDNLYTQHFPQQAQSLRDSLRTTKNILAMSLFNNAFNGNVLLADRTPLCSDVHPLAAGGEYSNMLGDATAGVALSEAGIEEALILAQSMKSPSGLPIQVMPRKLLVSRRLQFIAAKLVGSAFAPASRSNGITSAYSYGVNTATGVLPAGTPVNFAPNDINPIHTMNLLPEGYTVNQFLNTTNDKSPWFLLTDAEDGLKHYQRAEVKTDTYVDFATDNVMAKATERYSFGCSNPRAVIGSIGA